VLVWASIAVPNYRGGRATPAYNSCQVQLRQMNDALRNWAAKNRKQPRDTYSLDDPTILAYLKGSALPFCPGGGHYSPGKNLADKPKCSIPGHTL
jgi:hypothetical protein